MTTTKRIAFVYYPYNPNTVRLESMPFAINTIDMLTAAGWEVDIFLWEKAAVNYFDLFDRSAVRILHQKTPRGITRIQLTAKFLTCVNYGCIFAVGQIGSYLGGVASIASRCPLVIVNDEFPSFWGQSPWAPLERWAARRAEVFILPSGDRRAQLAKELDLNCDKAFIEIRNTPKIKHPLEERDWHNILGIPLGKKIFLHAGSVADWTQVPEILSSVVYWPPNAVVLLHGRESDHGKYRQQLSHLDVSGRVYWSSSPLSERLLNSLVTHCDGNFALFRNNGPNIVLTGTSSGKLMRSLACGCPVIASNYDSLAFVTSERVGIQVNHPSEIPAAVRELSQSSDAYRARCRSFAAQEVVRAQESGKALKVTLRRLGVPLPSPSAGIGVKARA